MEKLLEEIKTTPGVMGACVYSTERGVLASNLPAIFNPDTQKRIASILHRIFKLNETVKLDVNAYEIQYDEALILVKQLCNLSSLVVICEPDVNVHLVNMSISMLTADMLALLKECDNAPPVVTDEQDLEIPEAAAAPEPPPTPEPVATPPVAEAPPSEPVDAATVLSGDLAGEMETLRKALAKCIGPIAGMTLEGAIESWTESGPPSRERLGELAEDLLPEIDDDASRKEFLADLKGLI